MVYKIIGMQILFGDQNKITSKIKFITSRKTKQMEGVQVQTSVVACKALLE